MSLPMNRRSVVKFGLLAPLALALPRISFAAGAPANALPESDPMANALKYKADASKADPSARTDKKAFCNNCAKYNKCSPADTACKPAASAKADYAPCELFAGKQVSHGGWCMSWTKK